VNAVAKQHPEHGGLPRRTHIPIVSCPAGVAAYLIFSSVAGYAAEPIDTVRLADGSTVKGEILRLNDDDELVVDTEFADEVEIEVEHIVGIEVNRPFTVRRLDGEKITGYLAISPDGRLIVQDTPTVPAQSQAPAPVPALEKPTPATDSTAPPADFRPLETVAATFISFRDIDWLEEKPAFYRYEAEINVGVQAARGNSHTTDLHFDARFEPSFGWDTITLSAQYDKKDAEGDTTTDRLLAAGVYEHDFDRRWIGGLISTYERDRQRDLTKRLINAAGGGYKFYDHDPMHLKTFIAFAYVIEDFEMNSADRDFPGALWRLDFERDLYKDDITFYHNHQFVESFEQLSNFLVQTTTGLAIDIFDFTLSAEVQFDWNNDPSEDSDEQDVRYLLKLGYEFEGDENDWWQ
jgi:hypothetical protein